MGCGSNVPRNGLARSLVHKCCNLSGKVMLMHLHASTPIVLALSVAGPQLFYLYVLFFFNIYECKNENHANKSFQFNSQTTLDVRNM